MANKGPDSLRIRAFQVGYGDCFLLTFRYSNRQRHILIDFGSAVQRGGSKSLKQIAGQIQEFCAGELHGIVASNRQQTHIAGFETSNGGGPGDIIAACNPRVIVRPWTDDPQIDSLDAKTLARRYGSESDSLTAGLTSIQDLASEIGGFTSSLSRAPKAVRKTAQFTCNLSVDNPSASENLDRMAKASKASFVQFGGRSGLERILPGIEIHVLGPASLKQADRVGKRHSRNSSEYWDLQARAMSGVSYQGRAKSDTLLFPKAERWGKTPPIWSRWMVERLSEMNADSLLQLVHSLNGQLDNTSVILLLKIGDMSLLFPGDAHFDAWRCALESETTRELLKSVRFYKVGNHGSQYGTPKQLWNLFEHRDNKSQPLFTINSTMGGQIGDARRQSEVPRRSLVDALRQHTKYSSTQEIGSRKVNYLDFEIDFLSNQIEKVVPGRTR